MAAIAQVYCSAGHPLRWSRSKSIYKHTEGGNVPDAWHGAYLPNTP